MDSEPILLTLSQAADLLQIGRDTMTAWTRLPGFPLIRQGRVLRIPRRALLDWLDARARQDAAPAVSYATAADLHIRVMPPARRSRKAR